MCCIAFQFVIFSFYFLACITCIQWLTATGFIIFDPPQNPRPLIDRQKFCVGDYVHNPYPSIKLDANTSMGWACGQMGEI